MFVELFVQVNSNVKGNFKVVNYLSLVKGTHWSLVDSPHKWPEIRKTSLCHDVIMAPTVTERTSCRHRMCWRLSVGQPSRPPVHYSDVIISGVSNRKPHDCLLSRLFRRRSKKTSKLRATGLCVGNSPVTAELSAQRASNAENVSIWWRHHDHMTIYIIHIRRHPGQAFG